MSPWWIVEGQDKERRSRPGWGGLRIAFILVSMASLFFAFLAFSEGESWVRVSKHLTIAILFGLLAAKGPNITSTSAAVKLLAAAVFFVYTILLVIQIVME